MNAKSSLPISGTGFVSTLSAPTIAAAAAVVGAERIDTDPMPNMASEDFAFMLEAKPGCYLWLGSGGEGTANLHNPRYDFNDDALAIGASYWVTLAEQRLAAR